MDWYFTRYIYVFIFDFIRTFFSVFTRVLGMIDQLELRVGINWKCGWEPIGIVLSFAPFFGVYLLYSMDCLAFAGFFHTVLHLSSSYTLLLHVVLRCHTFIWNGRWTQIGMVYGDVMVWCAGARMKDLPRSRNSPLGGPLASMVVRAATRSCWLPQRVPMSRVPNVSSHFSMFLSLLLLYCSTFILLIFSLLYVHFSH